MSRSRLTRPGSGASKTSAELCSEMWWVLGRDVLMLLGVIQVLVASYNIYRSTASGQETEHTTPSSSGNGTSRRDGALWWTWTPGAMTWTPGAIPRPGELRCYADCCAL